MTDFTYQEGTPLTWAQMNENLRLMQAKYLDASNNAAIAIAAANFKGNWSALTGALAVPASVYHSSKFWLLLSNLADVTAATPGASGSWVEVITGNVMGPASATAGNLAVLDATGRVLSDGGVALAALMVKAGGTMSGVLEVVAGSVSAPGVAVSSDTNTGIYSPGADQLGVATGGTLRLSVDASGNVLSRSGGLGYGVGAGGTVTQATSKSTSVTLNKACGQITMSNSALAANTTTAFILNNSFISATDVVLVSVNWNASFIYSAWVYTTQNGSCSIALRNISAGSASDAVVLNFVVIKGATS